jgi:hypothetical protein
MSSAPLTHFASPAPHAREANQSYLLAQTARVKLLIERRILWLRQRWAHDPLKSYGASVVSDQAADMLLKADDPAAEARFHGSDPRAHELSRAIDEIERELTERENALERSETPPAMLTLARTFALRPLERDVLALCMAPELDPTLELLYAYVQDDASRRHATAGLAASLFEAEPEAMRAALAPHAPLRRLELVASDGSTGCAMATRPLRLADRVVEYLLGDPRVDPRVERWMRPIASARLTEDHEALAIRLADFAAAHDEIRVIGLAGPPRAGKRAIARTLAARLGLVMCELELPRLPAAPSERDEALRLLEREAGLARLAYYIDASDIDRSDRSAVTSADDIVERLNTLVVVGGNDRYPSRSVIATTSVTKADGAAQRELWRVALASHDAVASNAELDLIVQQFDLGPTEIDRCIRNARADATLSGGAGAALTSADVWRTCRAEVARAMDALGQRIVPAYCWDDLVLPPDVSQRLRELAAQVANRARVYDAWGLAAKLPRGRGISALFAGPSGVGKTMAAEVIAHHLDLDLFRIDLAGVVSKYIGETEKNLKRVFDAAEASGAILFFDEADALFGKRTEVKDSHDRYANIEVNYLLQRMEDYRGLAILATNMKSHLDPAFLRRLRFIIDIPPPDAAVRREIWRRVFPPGAPVEPLDLDALARMEVTGGNIRNIAVNAAFLAAAADGPIRMEHVLHAARREYDKLGKMTAGAEFGLHLTRTGR